MRRWHPMAAAATVMAMATAAQAADAVMIRMANSVPGN